MTAGDSVDTAWGKEDDKHWTALLPMSRTDWSLWRGLSYCYKRDEAITLDYVIKVIVLHLDQGFLTTTKSATVDYEYGLQLRYTPIQFTGFLNLV